MAWGLSAERAITQFRHDAWTRESGLPADSIFQIVQTQDGFLWLRTSAGLLRFDGVHFEHIDLKSESLTQQDSPRAISRTRDGLLLVRGHDQTLLLRSGEQSTALPTMPLPDGNDRLVYVTKAGRIWVGSDNNISELHREGVKIVVGATGLVDAIMEAQNGSVWIGTSRGLFCFNDTSVKAFPVQVDPELPFQIHITSAETSDVLSRSSAPLNQGITALVEDDNGVIWVGTQKGMYKLVNGTPVHDEVCASLGGVRITQLLIDRDKTLWVATDGDGIFRYGSGRWSSFAHREGLADAQVLCLAEDREGIIWLGTRSGLERLVEPAVTTFTPLEGLGGTAVETILQARDGAIYVGGPGVLTRIQGKDVSVYREADGMGTTYVSALTESRDGRVWFATRKGLNFIEKGVIHDIPANAKLFNQYISALGEDEEGLLIATSRLVLYRLINGELAPYLVHGVPTLFTKPHSYVTCLYTDAEGTSWIAADRTLYKCPKGVPPSAECAQPAITFSVSSIYDDKAGSFWLVGEAPGLTRFHPADGKVTHYTTKDGLSNNTITRVIGDGQGSLWLSAQDGVSRVSTSELDEFERGRLQKISARIFNTLDGMKSAEASQLDHQPAGCLAHDGKLWFSTRKGVVIIDPKNIPTNSVVPTITLTELTANYSNRLEPRDHALLIFPPGTQTLDFHYTASSMLVPSRVRFKYRLEGFDAEWIDAGTRRSAYYTNLPPGTYKFRVIGCNNDSVWNTEGAFVSIKLKPYFYQTNWFRVACVLSALSASFGIHRVRIHSLRKQKRELQNTVEERTSSLRAEIEIRKRAEAEAIRVHKKLEAASHAAGKAEIAIYVLHNIGNALNSVNISVQILRDIVQESKVTTVQKVLGAFSEHSEKLSDYLLFDPKGQQMPLFLMKQMDSLRAERQAALTEINALSKQVDHMIVILAEQRAHAETSAVTEEVLITDLLEEAIEQTANDPCVSNLKLIREYAAEAPSINTERLKVLQIFIILLQYAKRRCAAATGKSPTLEIRVQALKTGVVIEIIDDGIGHSHDEVAHAFDFRPTESSAVEHRGLHNTILLARQMGGDLILRSEGRGRGSTLAFTLPYDRSGQ